MNRGLEFHDSEVSSILVVGDDVLFTFRAAYIHESIGTPGVTPGDGWVQSAELVLVGGAASLRNTVGVDTLSDGFIEVQGQRYSVLPVPFSASAPVTAEFSFVSGLALRLSARGIRCTTSGPAQWVEAYAG